ncbi:MAG TPA: hypothetical protein VF466_03160 [Candidatus Saccharimonadales bacterium]
MTGPAPANLHPTTPSPAEIRAAMENSLDGVLTYYPTELSVHSRAISDGSGELVTASEAGVMTFDLLNDRAEADEIPEVGAPYELLLQQGNGREVFAISELPEEARPYLALHEGVDRNEDMAMVEYYFMGTGTSMEYQEPGRFRGMRRGVAHEVDEVHVRAILPMQLVIDMHHAMEHDPRLGRELVRTHYDMARETAREQGDHALYEELQVMRRRFERMVIETEKSGHDAYVAGVTDMEMFANRNKFHRDGYARFRRPLFSHRHEPHQHTYKETRLGVTALGGLARGESPSSDH